MVNSVVVTTFTGRIRDPKKHTAAYKLYHYTYDVKLPAMYIYSENYVRIAGKVVTGEKEIDDYAPREMIGSRLTPAQMADFIDEGAPIEIQSPQDALTIYEHIYQHLQNWADTLKSDDPFAHTKVPMDDLRKFSQLADRLYPNAARFFKITFQTSKLMSRLQSVIGNRKVSLSSRVFGEKAAEVVEKEKVNMPTHTRLTDEIINNSSRKTPWS